MEIGKHNSLTRFAAGVAVLATAVTLAACSAAPRGEAAPKGPDGITSWEYTPPTTPGPGAGTDARLGEMVSAGFVNFDPHVPTGGIGLIATNSKGEEVWGVSLDCNNDGHVQIVTSFDGIPYSGEYSTYDKPSFPKLCIGNKIDPNASALKDPVSLVKTVSAVIVSAP